MSFFMSDVPKSGWFPTSHEEGARLPACHVLDKAMRELLAAVPAKVPSTPGNGGAVVKREAGVNPALCPQL
jgi:hypothetical protein